jgi:hypothetical protein
MGILTRARTTSKPVSGTRRWLTDDGAFLFGKYRGEFLELVAADDEGYVRWCVESVEDMEDEDREAMEAALKYRGRE